MTHSTISVATASGVPGFTNPYLKAPLASDPPLTHEICTSTNDFSYPLQTLVDLKSKYLEIIIVPVWSASLNCASHKQTPASAIPSFRNFPTDYELLRWNREEIVT